MVDSWRDKPQPIEHIMTMDSDEVGVNDGSLPILLFQHSGDTALANRSSFELAVVGPGKRKQNCFMVMLSTDLMFS